MHKETFFRRDESRYVECSAEKHRGELFSPRQCDVIGDDDVDKDMKMCNTHIVDVTNKYANY